MLCWTAAQMIVSEPLFKEYFDTHAMVRIGVYAFVFASVGLGFLFQRRRSTTAAQAA